MLVMFMDMNSVQYIEIITFIYMLRFLFVGQRIYIALVLNVSSVGN